MPQRGRSCTTYLLFEFIGACRSYIGMHEDTASVMGHQMQNRMGHEMEISIRVWDLGTLHKFCKLDEARLL